MKKIITKLGLLFFVLFSTYIAYALATAPKFSVIERCPITSINKIMLCARNPNYVSIDEVSEIAIQSIIVSEDIRFYEHHGFDFHEIMQSIKKNFGQFKAARGGSTITQQVVKNVFLSRHKTLNRKIQEAYLTFKLEKMLSKRQILEKYLNIIEFGPNIFGIKPAAAFYFHKNAKDLTTRESAYLAHLLPNPTLYSNSFKQQKLTPFNRSRVLHIFKTLWSSGTISAVEYLSLEQSIDDFPWYVNK